MAAAQVPYFIRNSTQVRKPILRYLRSLVLYPIAEDSEIREIPR